MEKIGDDIMPRYFSNFQHKNLDRLTHASIFF